VKILLADDDPIARSIHSKLLWEQGHEVMEVADGEMAWQLIEKGASDFVVSDWLMPHLAGVDLCRRIRGAEFEHYVYVILCTSKGAKSDLIEGMDGGADDFLVKPISREELRVKVRAGERVLTLQQRLADKNRELEQMNRQLQSSHRVLEDDLKAAAWIQQRMLPPQTLESNGVQCEWCLEPCTYIAGDSFNFFALDEKEVGFYLLDVSGHGVPAAMLSVTLSVMLTPDASHGSPLKRYNPTTRHFEVLSPADAIRELNRRFQMKDERYFTMVYGVFNTQTSTLKIAQAGHPGPIIIPKQGRPQLLGSGGMPLGLWNDIEFDYFDVPICPGDRLLLYSDGVTECMNPEGHAFGDERLISYLADASSLPLNRLISGLSAKIKNWRGKTQITDDLSLMVVEMNGNPVP
jgi:sigma-B regulation protein RsbU (phosphoserine phosphatase)